MFILTSRPHPLTHWLIDFFQPCWKKARRDVTHAAIDDSALSTAWKLSRDAEASLSLHEFDSQNEGFFIKALQIRPIGELIKLTPDTGSQLVGDGWFRLTQTYGEWLYLSPGPERKTRSLMMLPAMIENKP